MPYRPIGYGLPHPPVGPRQSGKGSSKIALPGTQIAEVLADKGLITPPGDAGALESALLRLAADARLRQRFGQEARRYALKHMDREDILRRFEARLTDLSNDPPSFPQEELVAN